MSDTDQEIMDKEMDKKIQPHHLHREILGRYVIDKLGRKGTIVLYNDSEVNVLFENKVSSVFNLHNITEPLFFNTGEEYNEQWIADQNTVGVTTKLKAKREHHYPMYELIEPCFTERLAETMTEGFHKYGRDNWKNFSQEQIDDIQRHAYMHIQSYMNGDTSEDHLGHCAANIMFLMYFESKGKKTRTADITRDEIIEEARRNNQ